MIRYAIVLAPCLLALIWLGEKVMFTDWRLPFVIFAVSVVFSIDRVHVLWARRRMREEAREARKLAAFRTFSDRSGEVVAWFPEHHQDAA